MFLGRAWKRSWCLELGVSRSARQEGWCASGSRGDCDWWEEVKALEVSVGQRTMDASSLC